MREGEREREGERQRERNQQDMADKDDRNKKTMLLKSEIRIALQINENGRW